MFVSQERLSSLETVPSRFTFTITHFISECTQEAIQQVKLVARLQTSIPNMFSSTLGWVFLRDYRKIPVSNILPNPF
jgi:hypothetical protein